MRVGATVTIGLATMTAGVIVVALPDDGERLVSLSDEHGPSALDAVGIVVLLAGWSLLAALVWRRRGALPRGPRARALGYVVAAAAVILAVAVAFDLGALWLAAAAVMAAVQAYLLVVAVR